MDNHVLPVDQRAVGSKEIHPCSRADLNFGYICKLIFQFYFVSATEFNFWSLQFNIFCDV